MFILGVMPYVFVQAMNIEDTLTDIIVFCWFILLLITALVVRKQ